MSDLIATLKTQHGEVLRIVSELDAAVRDGKPEPVGGLLSALRRALAAHLALEDEQLYPGLVAAAKAKGDDRMESIAVTFSQNMKRITDALMAFLARQEGKSDGAAFSREWRSISVVITQRIDSEEGSLYPMYQRASGQPPPKRVRPGSVAS